MITNAYGEVYQHLEYFPYGESWIEEGGSYGGNTPGYKFTGKELDPETGLYYFGARYYEPVISKWISADPILGSYLDGKFNEGVFNSKNLSLFAYASQRPTRLIDPTGLFDTETGTIESGDTLTSISKEYNKKYGSDTNADELASIYNIKDKDKIYAGDTLAPPKEMTDNFFGMMNKNAETMESVSFNPALAISFFGFKVRGG